MWLVLVTCSVSFPISFLCRLSGPESQLWKVKLLFLIATTKHLSPWANQNLASGGIYCHLLGILSRVTESVKNIVPGWLQRYFNKNEDVCSCSTDTREVPQWPENREDDHLIYADEESANIHDGRLTPEPTVSNTGEPSTTSTASNYPDVLTRPSLHRSHLNFSMLESPSLHCQPSTSSAFPIGSSGFSLVKEIKDSTSQHDDDNISTTSGFSSRASDKDITVSKNTSVPALWSPEAERPHALSQHTAASAKKPAFNLSAFGTLSPSLGSSSFLKTSQLGDSPFYPGKTTYGGAAAAVRQTKLQNTPYQAPFRRQMKAKQLNAEYYGVTSSTARRILQSLEKMSSPLADAKRIPSVVSSPLNSPLDRSAIDTTTDFRAKREKVVCQYPPVQRLMTPKQVSIAANRTAYFKPSLTPSGELRKTNQRIDKKHSEMEVPVLPNISLPITSSSLPTFNFSSSVITSPSPVSPVQSLTNKVQMTSSNNTNSPMFRFSSPIVKSTEADVLPPSSIGFTFSVPVAKTAELSGSSSISEPITSSSAQDITAMNSASCKKPDEDCEGPFRPAKTLKEGSVLDVLKNPGFTSPKADSLAADPITTSPVVYTRPAISSFSSSGIGLGESLKAGSSWQCDTCLLQNKVTDSKCIACQATKLPPRDTAKQTGVGTPSKSGKPTLSTSGTGFGDKFKPAVGTWDCDTCLVQNKPEAIKCVACETPKPGTGVKRVLTLPVASENAVTVAASSSSCTVTTGALGFADKFTKPKRSWECPVCCVSNNPEDNKCVSCMSEKPGSSVPASSTSSVPPSVSSGGCLGLDKFKKPEGSWDCEVCLVQNKADSTKCVACESAKPGTKSEFKGFGTSSSSNPTASSFKFGIPSSSSEPSQTLTSPGNFKFGDQGGFKIVFGKKADNEEPKCQPVFSFGNSEQTKDESSSKSTFSFSLAKPSEKESEQPATKATFAFGVQTSTTADQGGTKPAFSFLNNSSNSSTQATSAGGSIFGSSTSSSAPMGAFVFGQASNPVSSSAFGNPAESSTSQSLLFPQESKPVTTSNTGTAVTPFVFGPGASSNNTATSGFNFGATTTSGSSGCSFVFGTGPSAPSASPAFGANQTPTFGQSQGASQPNPPGFGSISSSALFSAGSQPAPPTFGTVSSSSQPPVFGQQPGQSAFGSGTAPNSSSVFQFGSSTTNFNFTNNNPSGVFTFGANPSTAAASAQPSGSGSFTFNQPSASFTVGSNGKNMFSSGTSVPGRKIKTAVRRRK
ncbi:nuclear pore complex protein Nup153 isoform X3 [Molossus molossus]|uniref:nuclear pore complex protein Nup153 isoform X3 n=1 Tax=Molossus molossus TaxID=27622 RepID=UPI001747AD7C|nr:nuclear pore complex protein Nup153 isoform X3 [Molossus molossus]